jgi:predicted DCC family thiol-disulfide oxidoreductase YuxK
MKEGPIVFFDGVCNFCNYWVNFAIKRDKKKILRFAPLQGTTAKEMLPGIKTENPDSVIFLENGKIYKNSTAALRVAKNLSGGWKSLYGLMIFPAFIRDAVYRWIAKNRYKWYGKKESCMIPSPELKDRFLP